MPEKDSKKEGVIIKKLPDANFTVRLDGGGEVLAYLAGKMRLNYIKVMEGDRVILELSPDGKRGRIVFRK